MCGLAGSIASHSFSLEMANIDIHEQNRTYEGHKYRQRAGNKMNFHTMSVVYSDFLFHILGVIMHLVYSATPAKS